MKAASQELWTLLANPSSNSIERFDPTTTRDLPEPARRFLTAAIPAGAPLVTGVELEMTGRIKLGVWLPFTAKQILRAGVGLVWAPIVGGPIIRFVGADTLGPDGAHMQFRFHGRIPIVNASGTDIDRSAAGRLAAETVAWLPQALTPQVGATWKPLGDDRATVSLDGPDGLIDVDVTIDRDGRLTDIDLQRWNNAAKPPAYESFGGTTTTTFDADGVAIAGTGTVGWGRDTANRDDSVFFGYRITSAKFLGDQPT